jgi:hypothetical protein
MGILIYLTIVIACTHTHTHTHTHTNISYTLNIYCKKRKWKGNKIHHDFFCVSTLSWGTQKAA